MNGRTRVLTNWHPSKLDRDVIEKEFRELLVSLGFELDTYHVSIEVRTPELGREIARYESATNWHKDGTGIKHNYIALWSNTIPTEVMLPDGSLLEVRDGDVVLLENEVVTHRYPQAAAESNERWFARAWLKNEEE